MTQTQAEIAPVLAGTRRAPKEALQELLPKIVLAPSFAVILVFVYGFIVFTGFLSFSGSKLLPDFSTWVGFDNYVRLFNHPNWIVSLKNLAIFSVLYIVICSVIGLALAIFLDQKIRGDGPLQQLARSGDAEGQRIGNSLGR